VTFPHVVDYLEGGCGKASRLVAADDPSAAIRFVRQFYLGWVVWKNEWDGLKIRRLQQLSEPPNWFKIADRDQPIPQRLPATVSLREICSFSVLKGP